MLVRFLVALVAALALAALAEALLEWRDAHALPMRGRLVDAGGHKLRIVESGAGQSGPTVILECGIGGATAASWGWVQHGVERFAPVIAYDRAGLGWSEPGPLPRNGRRLVEELHTLLLNAGHSGPYIFVGHSYGGLLARLYVDRYPGDVVGVVLVESAHPRQFGERRRMPRWFGIIRGALPFAPWAARIGLMRLGTHLIHMDVKSLPPLERREQLAFLAEARHWEGTLHEMQSWVPLTNDEAAQTHGFGDRPLAVLTAGTSARWSTWAALQSGTAALSSNSVHETVAGATHAGIISDSTYAARVIEAIRAVRESAMHGGPVTLRPADAPR